MEKKNPADIAADYYFDLQMSRAKRSKPSDILLVLILAVFVFAVAVCVFLCMPESKGILYGGIAGLVSAIFMQFTFLALSAKFSVSEFLINGLFCVIFGAIFGIIWVNLKNRAKST